jgi:hypothetical protein
MSPLDVSDISQGNGKAPRLAELFCFQFEPKPVHGITKYCAQTLVSAG